MILHASPSNVILLKLVLLIIFPVAHPFKLFIIVSLCLPLSLPFDHVFNVPPLVSYKHVLKIISACFESGFYETCQYACHS